MGTIEHAVIKMHRARYSESALRTTNYTYSAFQQNEILTLPNVMFLVYALLMAFLNHTGDAAQIDPSKTSSPWSVVLSLIPFYSELQPQRTHSNIVWSCILTAVLCSWTSIHPNLPPQSRSRRLLRGVRTMFWTIVAPELILGWAVRQWFAAKEIRDFYNRHRPYGMSK